MERCGFNRGVARAFDQNMVPEAVSRKLEPMHYVAVLYNEVCCVTVSYKIMCTSECIGQGMVSNVFIIYWYSTFTNLLQKWCFHFHLPKHCKPVQ